MSWPYRSLGTKLAHQTCAKTQITYRPTKDLVSQAVGVYRTKKNYSTTDKESGS
uniref:Uncharacterized protein n=1 Tax=Arion vulgaris TaxID=1028688 RepID=A0A0B7AP37_9EUPU